MAALEIGAAVVLGRILTASAEKQGFANVPSVRESGAELDGGDGATQHEHGGSGHHDHGASTAAQEPHHQTPADPAVPGTVWLCLALSIALTVAAVVVVRRRPKGGPAAVALAVLAVLACVAIVWPNVLDAVLISHFAMMPALMTATMSAPILIVRSMRLSDRITIRTVPLVGTTSAAVLVAITIGWHLPALHLQLMQGGTMTASLLVVGLIAGVAFWTVALDSRDASRGWRRRVITLFGLPTGLLGLTLLVAPGPVMPDHGFSWLSAMTDQRLGGVYMMVVDIVLLIPTLLAAADTSTASRTDRFSGPVMKESA